MRNIITFCTRGGIISPIYTCMICFGVDSGIVDDDHAAVDSFYFIPAVFAIK